MYICQQILRTIIIIKIYVVCVHHLFNIFHLFFLLLNRDNTTWTVIDVSETMLYLPIYVLHTCSKMNMLNTYAVQLDVHGLTKHKKTYEHLVIHAQNRTLITSIITFHDYSFWLHLHRSQLQEYSLWWLHLYKSHLQTYYKLFLTKPLWRSNTNNGIIIIIYKCQWIFQYTIVYNY